VIADFQGENPKPRTPKGFMYTYTIILAALLFSSGGYFMKLSEGMTRVVPTVAFLLLFLLGAVMQTVALEKSQLSVTYVIVLGIEAVTAFLLGIFMLGEHSSPLKMGGTALILAGIIALRLSE
jgi:multidrug transporter EmrE-like cation transporter